MKFGTEGEVEVTRTRGLSNTEEGLSTKEEGLSTQEEEVEYQGRGG